MNNDDIQQANLVNDDVVAAADSSSQPNFNQPATDTFSDPAPSPDPMVNPVPPQLNQPAPAPPPADVPSDEPSPAGNIPPSDDTASQLSGTDDLDSIKRAVIGDLQPLVPHLDQPPEEKFQTLMMMIRTTDDTSLIEQAYSAARSIEDDVKRANALLDVVSEIDYLKNQKK